MPTHIVKVVFPADRSIRVGRIGPQPNFGLMSTSDFQYQLLE